MAMHPAKYRRERGSRYRRSNLAADSEEQLGRPGSAGLPSASSLIFWLGRDHVHRGYIRFLRELQTKSGV